MSASNDNKGSRIPLVDLTSPFTWIVEYSAPGVWGFNRYQSGRGGISYICRRDFNAADPSSNETVKPRRKQSHLSVV
jgi:hypothetical protein